MEAEESSSSFQYTTTEKHVEDWFEENQWWVEDLDDRNKIKLAQLFYIYQVYESMRNISIIPQDAEQRKKFAFCLLDKMGFTKEDKKKLEASLRVIKTNSSKDKNIYTLSPFFLTSKDGANVLNSFTRFEVFDRVDMEEKKATLAKKLQELEKVRKSKNEEQIKLKEQEYMDLMKFFEEETEASLNAFYATPTPAATVTIGGTKSVVTSHALSDVDINKLTKWFVNVDDKTIDIFKEVYLNSNESKSILNAFVYFIVMGKNLGDNEAQGIKAKIRTFMEDTTRAREDGAVNEWVTMLLQTPDEAQLTRMLSYNVFNKYFDSVKSLLDENIADAKETLILKLVESLYKFVIYDEVKTHKDGRSMTEDNVEKKVNNIFEVQQIIKNPEIFIKMKLFDVIMKEGSFKKIDYSMIKQSYDDIEDLYAKLEQRYTNITDNNDIKKNIANNYYNCLEDIDIDKFKLLEKLYGKFTDKNFKTKTKDIKEAKPLFYKNILQMYVDSVGTDKEIPYEVKFLYDIVYFAHIQCRPDIFDIQHETMLDYKTVWNSKVPYVANLNNFYEDKNWYYHYSGSWNKKETDTPPHEIYTNFIDKVCRSRACIVNEEKKEISSIYSYSLDETTIYIKQALSNENNSSISTIIDYIQKLSSTTIRDKEERINMFYCMLSDQKYKTKFVEKDNSSNFFTSMIRRPPLTVTAAALTDTRNKNEIMWANGDLEVPYPRINFPGRESKSDGGKKKKLRNNKMDGATLLDISKVGNQFDSINSEGTLLFVTLLFMKTETISNYKDFEELNLNQLIIEEKLKTFKYKEIKLKIKSLENEKKEYDIYITSFNSENQRQSIIYTLSQEEINKFNKIHQDWENEQNKLGGNTSIESMINFVYKLLETLKQSARVKSFDMDITLAIWKTLRRFQPIIKKYDYDNFKVRYMKSSSSDGEGKEEEDYIGMKKGESFTPEFVYNVLLAVGYIYRDSESQLEKVNTKLDEKKINEIPFKIEVQNNPSNTTIKVLETGYFFNAIRAEVIIPYGMISDKEFTTFYMSEEVPVKTHKTQFLTEELLQRYIWNVSFQVQDKRKIQEITTIDKLKSFVSPQKIVLGIVFMVCLYIVYESFSGVATEYNYGDIVKDYFEVPEVFKAQVPKIAQNIPEPTKKVIKDMFNPLIESKTCSINFSSNSCKVSMKDTLTSWVSEGLGPKMYDKVIYPSKKFMESLPSKIDNVNLWDYLIYHLDLKLLSGINAPYFDGSRKKKNKTKKSSKIRQLRKSSIKHLQKSSKQLRRSARIQAQAKKLRKSLKKRRCDGTSDLFSSCYVNKTAY